MADEPSTAALPQDAAPGRNARLLSHPLLHALIVVAIVLLGWIVATRWDRWTGAGQFQRSEDAYVTGDRIPLSTQVSGYVRQVAVDDNQRVDAGQLVAEIEPSDYRAQRDLAAANLAAARANLAGIADNRAVQQALIAQAQATIEISQAELARAGAEARRQRDLLRQGLAGTLQHVEQADADAAKAAGSLALARAQLLQQQALLTALDATESGAVAQVAAAAAQLGLAGNNLGYTRLTAPVAGMTGARQVRPGQFVAAGTQFLTLIPLPKLWIVANLKETQMTRLRLGNRAQVTVDAFPGVVLTGRVESWSPGTGSVFALLPPDNATGNFTKVVQRVPVKIVLDPNPSLGELIRPGMSVIATIDTGEGVPADGPGGGVKP